jgi:hypothetical protein
MARHIRLRPTNEHPAYAGRFAVLQSVSPVHLAAILATVAAGFLAVWQLAGLGGPRPAAPQPGALGKPQSRAPLGFVRGNRDRTRTWDRATRTLESRSRLEIPNVFVTQRSHTSDFRLLPVALLTLGANLTPAGLGSLKKRPGGSKVDLGGPAFAVADVLPVFGATVPAPADRAEPTKVLDLSRPTRAGPLRVHAIDTRASASSGPDSGLFSGGV